MQADSALSSAVWQVVLDVPLPGPFDYLPPLEADARNPLGYRVLVPWGTRLRIGLVVAVQPTTALAPERLRPVARLLTDLPALAPNWLALLKFAARYYQVELGSLALVSLPMLLRTSERYRAAAPRAGGPVARARALWARAVEGVEGVEGVAAVEADALPECGAHALPELTADQSAALAAMQLEAGFRPHLLYGVTGSGKTEVYLRAIERVLSRQDRAQALLLVPEIALTPQFVRVLRARFPRWRLAVLHSALSETERASAWVAAHEGQARLVVGTRMAVLASMAHCALIVVDEEHDSSYRQQEGARWSGRDLAVARARIEAVPIILGSATPSLESWQNAALGRYVRIELPRRAVAQARLPAVCLVDLTRARTEAGLAEESRLAIHQCLERGEQALVFLNRRGYAPVLTCPACGWVANCPNCSVTLALHRAPPEREAADGSRSQASSASPWRLICHHCGHRERVPSACTACGEVDLAALGRGTQRLEESIAAQFTGARILRIDRDATRQRGATEALLATVREGAVDLLVGTQMMAKGHDFPRLTLVVVLGADQGLHSHDFRAPERLFATLMQVAGRAGRGQQPGRVLIQTRWPGHPLFGALQRQDYAAFAHAELRQRRAARLPPFAHQALLCADAKQASDALAFLTEARAQAEQLAGLGASAPIALAQPVPMPLARVAQRERLQLLIESPSRSALQSMLNGWGAPLRALAQRHARVHWHLEVDPLAI